MIVGDFELFTWVDTSSGRKKAEIKKKHESFDLVEEDVYHLEFVIKEIKRKLELK